MSSKGTRTRRRRPTSAPSRKRREPLLSSNGRKTQHDYVGAILPPPPSSASSFLFDGSSTNDSELSNESSLRKIKGFAREISDANSTGFRHGEWPSHLFPPSQRVVVPVPARFQTKHDLGSRLEAQRLSSWFEQQIAQVDEKYRDEIQWMDHSEEGKEEPITAAINKQVYAMTRGFAQRLEQFGSVRNVLMKCFHELARQECSSCFERGELIARLWLKEYDTSVEMIRVLKEQVAGAANTLLSECAALERQKDRALLERTHLLEGPLTAAKERIAALERAFSALERRIMILIWAIRDYLRGHDIACANFILQLDIVATSSSSSCKREEEEEVEQAEEEEQQEEEEAGGRQQNDKENCGTFLGQREVRALERLHGSNDNLFQNVTTHIKELRHENHGLQRQNEAQEVEIERLQKDLDAERRRNADLLREIARLQEKMGHMRPPFDGAHQHTQTDPVMFLDENEDEDDSVDKKKKNKKKKKKRTVITVPLVKTMILHYITTPTLKTDVKTKKDRVLSLRATLAQATHLFVEKAYADLIDDRERTARCDMSEFTYNFYLHKYGLCALADLKVHQLCISLTYHLKQHLKKRKQRDREEEEEEEGEEGVGRRRRWTPSNNQESISRIVYLRNYLGLNPKVCPHPVKMDHLNFFQDIVRAAHENPSKYGWCEDEKTSRVKLSLPCALEVTEFMFPTSRLPPPIFAGGPPGRRKKSSPFCVVLKGPQFDALKAEVASLSFSSDEESCKKVGGSGGTSRRTTKVARRLTKVPKAQGRRMTKSQQQQRTQELQEKLKHVLSSEAPQHHTVDLDALFDLLMTQFSKSIDGRRNEMQDLFRRLDRNRDGTVTLDEFHSELRVLRPELRPKRITRLFRQALEHSSNPDQLTPRSFKLLADDPAFAQNRALLEDGGQPHEVEEQRDDGADRGRHSSDRRKTGILAVGHGAFTFTTAAKTVVVATHLAGRSLQEDRIRKEFDMLEKEYLASRLRIAAHQHELRAGGLSGYPAAEQAFRKVTAIKKKFEAALASKVDPERAWDLHRALVSTLSMELVTLRVSKKAGACKAAHPEQAQMIRMKTLRETVMGTAGTGSGGIRATVAGGGGIGVGVVPRLRLAVTAAQAADSQLKERVKRVRRMSKVQE